MGARSENSLATVLLAGRLLDADERALSTREFWQLVNQVPEPASLLGGDSAAVAAATGLPPSESERVAGLLDGATRLAFELERLELTGIHALTPFDEQYPETVRTRLQNAAPPVLHVAGDPGLMAEQGIGVVGSRDASMAALEVAAAAARVAVEHGWPVVSGAARGVDQAALAEAFQRDGTAVGVPADALDKRLRDPDTRRAVTSGRVCLVTPYKPSAGFSVANAMGRNKLIYALARVTLVVTTSLESGGTWSGATEALSRSIAPVAVWIGQGAGPGNERLVRLGGIAIEAVQELAGEWTGDGSVSEQEPAGQLGLGI
jgi:predicted Rossmann fold nucleotide-binding protein DprA/Smf involved in DNA uptake